MAFGSFNIGANSQPMAEINVIPLVDVMLVLLVIFIITAPLLTHQVKIDLPSATSAPSLVKVEKVQLSVDAAGQVFWNGESVSRASLVERMRAAGAQEPSPELHVHADGEARYAVVAEVLSEAAKARLSKIGFVTDPQAGALMRRVLLLAHRWAGLSAGLVLAVVGATGVLMALEDEIVGTFGAGIVTVAPRDQPVLSLPQLAPHAHAAGKPQSITIYAEPGRSARVQLAPAVKGGHAEVRYLDPYNGALLPPSRAEAFVETVEDVHRRLASGETGRRVTGTCVLLLAPMVLVGLWLRWPRPWSWSRWFGFDRGLEGRPFVRALHLASGAWVVPMLLVSALTGPYWAHEWYKAGVHRLAGVPLPGAARPTAGASPELAASWPAFTAAAPTWMQVTWRPGATHSFTYLLPDAPHSRARNRVEVDGAGAVVKHERHADKTAGGRLVASMFVIHSGAWLGVPGRIAMLLGALSLPLFALSGWLMFLMRRQAAAAAG